MNPWEDIKNQLNIVEVIGDYVAVKQIGASYKCVCPFHQDKNPSLTISPEKGLWHCFGCGAGGDAFRFVMDFENIDKKQALERLAKKAGIDLTKYATKAKVPLSPEEEDFQEKVLDEYQLGLKYLDWVTKVYHKLLLKTLIQRDNPIASYCIERGLNQELVEKFALGYAPKNNFILELAKKHSLDLEILKQIGIIKTDETGDLRDKFSDRLMIPVVDKNGDTVGFTGRILPYDKSDRPKYLNSSQSQWFNKSSIWYGWFLNQKRIRQAKKAIIVEGNMDVISATSKGLDFALASQGTSFTTQQLKNLKLLTSKVWLAFDNDNAGKAASNKFFLEATRVGLTVEKLIIPQNYKDLDEYLKSMEDSQNILDKIKTSPYLDYFLLENDFNLKNGDFQVQKETLFKILELLIYLDNYEKEHYLQKLSEITKKSFSAVSSEFQKVIKQKSFGSKFESGDATKQQSFLNDNSKNNAILVHFQNYLALVLAQNQFVFETLENTLKWRLEAIFNLLKSVLIPLQTADSLITYISENLEILKLIASENPDQDIENLSQIISRFLDQNLASFLLDENLSQLYLELKKAS